MSKRARRHESNVLLRCHRTEAAKTAPQRSYGTASRIRCEGEEGLSSNQAAMLIFLKWHHANRARA